MPPGTGEPSEETGAPLPGQESAEEEMEERGSLNSTQKALELEGNDMMGLNLSVGRDRPGGPGIEAQGFGFLSFGSHPSVPNILLRHN